MKTYRKEYRVLQILNDFGLMIEPEESENVIDSVTLIAVTHDGKAIYEVNELDGSEEVT